MISEKIVVGEKYPLDGLITLPATGAGPYPAVVLVHGSGASDMDENIYAVRPFKDIAEGLAQLGIACIRYNKRSFSYGKQMVEDAGKALTVQEEVVEDAIYAADLLRQDPRIDPDKIFIAGHSLGGMLAPRIDATGGNFAGLIILAGSPRRLEEIMKEQQMATLDTLKGPLKWIGKKQIAKIQEKLDSIYTKTDEEAQAIPFAGGTTIYYLKEMGQKTAAEYLAESNKPIFVLHPEKDVQVSLEKDFQKYKEILAGRTNASFQLYPGLNHAFMPSLYGTINKALKEFQTKQHVDVQVIADIADWIHSL